MATTTTTLQAKALYANTADTDEELSFAVGDVLTVHERDVAGLVGWWLCSLAGRIGIAPGNRLRLLTPPTGDALVPGDQQAAAKDSLTTTKPRPATAPHRGQTAQTTNDDSTSRLVVPRKSGNVYVYDDAVDYDVPAARHPVQRTENSSIVAAAELSQDYDVPTGVPSTLASCQSNDDDVDFGVGDYDLLSPPPQRPASDADAGASSNRSSVTSVLSGGSLSSGCASIRSAQSPSTCTGAAGARLNGYVPQLMVDQLASRRCISETTSDTSADSGITLQAAYNSTLNSRTSTLNGVTCNERSDAVDDVECFDYDVPVASTNNPARPCVNVVDERRSATTQRQCVSSINHVSPVVSNESSTQGGRCAEDDVRRRHVEELRDCVMRNVQRFLAWTGRAAGDVCRDAVATRQFYGQAKLAGLAVRTSLKELIAVVDGNPPALLHHHVNPLNQLLFEIDRRLDSLIAAGSEVLPHRLTVPVAGGRRAARESSASRDRLQAVAEVVADLPELVGRFTVFVVTNSAVVVRPPDDLDVIQSPTSSSCVHKNLPPLPRQRRDSHQRDKPPQSPPVSAGASPRNRRLPLSKPPPVKPKPPRSATWRRPPPAPTQPRPAVLPASTTTNVIASRPTPNGPKHERRVAELNKKNGSSSTDGWNEDDCDYVSIVREVEREMESLGKPVIKNPALGTNVQILSDDDRELLAFYAAQISAHVADVDVASTEFYRCCSSSPSVDAFVRRSRFVVLAAHRLVYVGDVIARHMTDRAVGDRVAAAANQLCDELKLVVMTTRDAAIATADNDNPAAAGARETMMESVGRATDDCRRLSDVINAIACR